MKEILESTYADGKIAIPLKIQEHLKKERGGWKLQHGFRGAAVWLVSRTGSKRCDVSIEKMFGKKDEAPLKRAMKRLIRPFKRALIKDGILSISESFARPPNLHGEVVLVIADERIEIWDKEVWLQKALMADPKKSI